MRHEIPPVIRRVWQKEDSEATVETTSYSDMQYHRGLGDSGKRIEHVTYDRGCPACTNENMVRLVQVSPVERDHVEYWCLNPGCRYFVNDELAYGTGCHPQNRPETPRIMTLSVDCPDCDRKHEVTVGHGSTVAQRHQERDANDPLPQIVCDECLEEY